MVIVSSSLRFAYEFACHSKACAPPPAGTGGSNSAGARAVADATRSRNARNAEHRRNRTGPFTRVSDLTSTGFVSRKDMPQLTGVPRPGSPADKLPRTDHGTVHAFGAFREALERRGVSVTDDAVPVKHLKASQNELDFGKISKMATTPTFDVNDVRLLVSSDNYVIDGHHRWGAQMMKDREATAQVTRIGLPARAAIEVARDWTRKFGLEAKRI